MNSLLYIVAIFVSTLAFATPTKPILLERPATIVIGYSANFKPGVDHTIIPTLWGGFTKQRHLVLNVTEPFVGVSRWIESEGQARYTAGSQVSEAEQIPLGMEAVEVQGGTYAQFIHRGPISKLGETLNFIYDEWLPKSGYKHTPDGYDIEIYPDGDVDSPSFELKYLIPLKK